MSQIDWSKAPEGATHFSDSDSRRSTFPAWWRPSYKHEGKYECWAVGTSIGCALWQSGPFELPSEAVKLEWTGEGLPPVGTVCELWIRADEWASCQVIAMDEQDGKPVSVVRYGGGYYAGTNKCLRPIRTPEQIAAEEREAKAKAMWQQIYFNTDPDYWDHAPEVTRDTFRAAIDAGWQKVKS